MVLSPGYYSQVRRDSSVGTYLCTYLLRGLLLLVLANAVVKADDRSTGQCDAECAHTAHEAGDGAGRHKIHDRLAKRLRINRKNVRGKHRNHGRRKNEW